MFAIVSAYHQFEQKTFSGDRLFMFYTFFVVFLGIVIQEVSGGALRTTSLTIAIGMCFLLNRFNNFTQKVSDLKISRDNVVMRMDIMTGMQNRYAYDEKLGEMVTLQGGKEFLAFSIDINGLKEMNDNRGHLARDDLIREVAAIIRDILGKSGECYRIGGRRVRRYYTRRQPARVEIKAAARNRGSQVPDQYRAEYQFFYWLCRQGISSPGQSGGPHATG